VIPWPAPAVPSLPGKGLPVLLHDTSTGRLVESTAGTDPGMYVCGITPYDATHLGHAATYVAFDLLHRAWLDAGLGVRHVQNVTDVDDPLLQRAAATGADWRALAARETARFADDMTALAVLPPTAYVGAVEAIPQTVDAVERLVGAGHAYRLDGGDVYFDVTSDPKFGAVATLDEPSMLQLFAARGGDAARPGKRHRLDALLWRAARPDEPSWDGASLGPGRPGWHIECTVIALEHLGVPFDVQGGGSDLAFPHHEMSASHGHALTSSSPFARAYVHAGMVGLDGEKMSKSRGNLVFVSRLRADGVDPAVIRLVLLAHHYRSDWEYSPAELGRAGTRLDRWREALSRQNGPDATATLAALRERLAADLDAPGALAAVDDWADEQLERGGDVEGAPGVVGRSLDALLGVRL
jgi:L-cysteine:1D-myo-inositol 2-amino-2-deoxy-alpha-D-glucopyranoside ligase